MSKIKKPGILRNFIITMSALSIFIVLLWVLFFYTTMRAFINNMTAQAETMSDSVMTNVESGLLLLTDTAAELSRSDTIAEMVLCDYGGPTLDNAHMMSEHSSFLGNYYPADEVLLRSDETFLVLRGNLPDTAIKQAYEILRNSKKNETFAVFTEETAYICCSEAVKIDDRVAGYIILFMEPDRLKLLFSPFDSIDYLGAVITSGNNLICANRDISYEDIADVKADSVIFKEKEIGLTGLKLLVYCENIIPRFLSRYFTVAFPVTIGILMLAIGIFIRYWNRHIVGPINSIIKNTNENADRPLPLTGEAYFDDLVEHVNDTLIRIEERDKELFDSRLKIKESELLQERTLLSLLKKQINAHFTVNTLNAVRALINKGEKEAASKMCNELSSLLRYANAGEEYISLLEEFYVLNQYASIMKTRYPQRFSFATEDDDSHADVFIPRMLLQPIVENSIIHGFKDKMGSIYVRADIGEDITVTVRDDGCGMSETELEELKRDITDSQNTDHDSINHVALANIERRIKLVCGSGYGLNIESGPAKGTTVTVRLPRKTG